MTFRFVADMNDAAEAVRPHIAEGTEVEVTANKTLRYIDRRGAGRTTEVNEDFVFNAWAGEGSKKYGAWIAQWFEKNAVWDLWGI